MFSKICKFADDTKIGRAVATEDEVQLLRNDLTNLAKWVIDWQMLFNVETCVVMHIGKNNKLYSYNMNNATLKAVNVERDLGVIIIYKLLIRYRTARCLRYLSGARLCVDEPCFRSRFDMLVHLFPSFNTLSLVSGKPN